ncbi:hypothetical protein IQ270_07870 [Microcoleus sp. LEGE 07076]|uniref:hypothetical protein n=1 Tax=Microcoleus sp. LEGE 07076 TaxID=915322 RepID=UPI001880E95A|nr:hypothetical protein [Microcoleus sp. LEGE 07076]MBE9184639.1 hypothetical protein [Microcoleus sp. LEGE 07076]
MKRGFGLTRFYNWDATGFDMKDDRPKYDRFLLGMTIVNSALGASGFFNSLFN